MNAVSPHPPSFSFRLRGIRLLVALLLSGTSLRSAGSADPEWLAPGYTDVHITRATAPGAWMIRSDGDRTYTVESSREYPAKPGDTFEVNVRLQRGVDTRALPELVCYDADGREIPAVSTLAGGSNVVTTAPQDFRRIFPTQPGTATVRARIRASGRAAIVVSQLVFGPRAVDAYQTGALVTQRHGTKRQGLQLESNFGIVNREAISRADVDGDGKWAEIVVDLDELTKAENRGNDWRTSIEDNPNAMLWSDGAVLKSDTVHADRTPDRARALHFRMKVRPGAYLAYASDPGRSLALSLDGANWQRHEGGREIQLGTVTTTDGTIELWLDACYRDPVSAGPAYFDYVRLLPARDDAAVERILASARMKPPAATQPLSSPRHIPVTVEPLSLPGLAQWPVRCGLPVPRGELISADNLTVLDAAGRPLPSQNRITATWPDGSARWIYLDFFHRPENGPRYTVSYGGAVRRMAETDMAVRTVRTDLGIEVDTGALRFLVPERYFGMVENVRLASGQVVQPGPIESRLTEAGGAVWSATDLPVTRLEIEQAGPLHAVILVETALAESGKPASGFHHRARIHAYAGSPLVEVDYFIANTDSRPAGDIPGSMSSKVVVRSLSLDIKPGSPITAARHALGTTGPAGGIIQTGPDEIQHQDGMTTHRARSRVPGWIGLQLAAGEGLQAGLSGFAEQFPKALRWSDRGLTVDLWAAEGGDFDWIEGVGKTHHLDLVYGPPPSAGAAILSMGPLFATANPEWYVRSGAMGDIATASSSVLPAVEATLERHMQGPVIKAVGRGFENYGDHNSNGYVVGTALWDNNEYDLPAACMIHFARTGNRAALQLGLASALHYIDVDVCHYSSEHADWARAQHTHSHALFGHHTAQGPDIGHAGYVQGLLWYTYLTGDPDGLLGARGIADWVLRNLGMHANGMERVLGHCLMTLNDVYEATGEEKYLRGAAYLVDQALRWEHPIRSGLLAPVTEAPAFSSGSTFNNGMTFSALMKFESWADLPELTRLLDRLAQWVLTDTWREPYSLQLKGGSRTRPASPGFISSHGRIMARTFQRTGDPLFLVVPAILTKLGYSSGDFGTRSTGLVYNYLPWLLAALEANGNPQPDEQLEITAEPLRLAKGSTDRIRLTLRNTGSTPVDGLRSSLRSRHDIAITPLTPVPAMLAPGETVELLYDIRLPERLNVSCDYNRIAHAHWSALFDREGSARMGHRTVKIEITDLPDIR